MLRFVVTQITHLTTVESVMRVKLARTVQVTVAMAVDNTGQREEWKGVSVMDGGVAQIRVMVGWVVGVEQREDSAEP